MRIAMIGHKRMPSREGGVEIVVEELSVRMARRGHDVMCYNRKGVHVSGKRYASKKLDAYCGVKIRYVPTIDVRGIAAVSASFFATVRAAFSRCDVIHFHSEGSCLMLWLAKLMGKRCIVTIHGLDHLRAKWGRMARTCISLSGKCAAALADEIIVLSKDAQTYFADVYKRDVRLIPNGVPVMEAREAEQIAKEFGLEKDGYILFLGRITPEKGIDYLIDAYRTIKTDKKLVIAGGSSDSDGYFASLKEKAKDLSAVVFTDFVQGRMLEELYSNAYVYVLPSDLEGMPMSLLEALSYGNCCLVSDIPENTAVVGECANVFARGDAKDLAAKLDLLCSDPSRVEACRAAAAQRVHELADWEEVVTKTLLVYEGKKTD